MLFLKFVIFPFAGNSQYSTISHDHILLEVQPDHMYESIHISNQNKYGIVYCNIWHLYIYFALPLF